MPIAAPPSAGGGGPLRQGIKTRSASLKFVDLISHAPSTLEQVTSESINIPVLLSMTMDHIWCELWGSRGRHPAWPLAILSQGRLLARRHRRVGISHQCWSLSRRTGTVSVAASVPSNFGGAGVSSTAAAENRSGVRSVGLRPMALACRVQGRSAISSERPVHTLQHSQTFRAPDARSLWWVARPRQKASTPSSDGFEGVSICSRTRLFTVLICVKDGSSQGQ